MNAGDELTKVKVANEIECAQLFHATARIVDMKEYFREEDRVYLVFERMGGGDLSRLLER